MILRAEVLINNIGDLLMGTFLTFDTLQILTKLHKQD